MADPDYEFMDGFDKYAVTTLLNDADGVSITAADNAEWTSGASTQFRFIDPLGAGADGHALYWSNSSSTGRLQKSLPTNYQRCVGGTHWSSASTQTIKNGLFQVYDGSSQQITIAYNPVLNKIEILRGSESGTVLATSSKVVAVNEVVCIEWDITVHNSTGVVKVWINGSLTDGCTYSGDTAATANNYYNGIGLHAYSFGRWDHFYTWHYLVSGGTETPCLTNPFIETDYPNSDSSVTFSGVLVGAGDEREYTFSNPALSANTICVIPITPDAGGTISHVVILPQTTYAAAKYRAVVYASDGVKATTLLGSSAEVIGMTADVPVTLAITSPPAVVAGTTYYIGIMSDTSMNFYGPGNNVARRWSRTYASGPDNPANTTQSLVDGVTAWAIVAGATLHYAAVNGAPQSFQYNFSSTIGQKDLFGFPALSVNPSNIYSVAVKGYMQRSDAGARTVDLLANISATDYSGSAPGQTPAASPAWNSTYFRKNPNTAAAWTKAGLDAAKFGYKVAT